MLEACLRHSTMYVQYVQDHNIVRDDGTKLIQFKKGTNNHKQLVDASGRLTGMRNILLSGLLFLILLTIAVAQEEVYDEGLYTPAELQRNAQREAFGMRRLPPKAMRKKALKKNKGSGMSKYCLRDNLKFTLIGYRYRSALLHPVSKQMIKCYLVTYPSTPSCAEPPQAMSPSTMTVSKDRCWGISAITDLSRIYKTPLSIVIPRMD